MMDSPPGPRTAAALAARRERVDAGLLKIEGTLDHMLRTRTPITFMAVARQSTGRLPHLPLGEHAGAGSRPV
jgi:hypothetical protein